MSDKKFSVTRDFKKQTLSVEIGHSEQLNQGVTESSDKVVKEMAKDVAKDVDRREALKSLAPSVGKSMTSFLRNLKMMVHEVTDKINKA